MNEWVGYSLYRDVDLSRLYIENEFYLNGFVIITNMSRK